MNNPPIVVVGVPRSGTSLVAGILQNLGTDMGESIPANAWNPRGFFEDATARACALEAMGAGGPSAAKAGGRADPLPPLSPAEDGPAMARLRAYVKGRAASGKPWGIKSNYLPWLWHHVADAAGAPLRAIVTRRPFGESAESLHARSGVPIERAVEAIGRHAYALDACLAQYRPETLTVEYHALVDDAAGQVARIAGWLGADVTPEAVSHVDPSIRRFGGGD